MKRGLSWLLMLVAVVLVPVWVHGRGQAFLDAQRAQDGYACGMPLLGLYLLAVMVAAVLSLVATALNALDFKVQPRPRHPLRKVELAVMAAPWLLAAAVLAMVLIA